ncbi:hypothetical protein BZM26_36450 [Paraburkholderia strydomiana]|nr:hypothetical protein BZM26_36450 [Paraburkholderia strydomiana]
MPELFELDAGGPCGGNNARGLIKTHRSLDDHGIIDFSGRFPVGAKRGVGRSQWRAFVHGIKGTGHDLDATILDRQLRPADVTDRSVFSQRLVSSCDPTFANRA